MRILKPIARLTTVSAMFRFIVGYMIVLPLLLGVSFTVNTIIASLITVTDGLVNKSQSIVSDVFVTNVKE